MAETNRQSLLKSVWNLDAELRDAADSTNNVAWPVGDDHWLKRYDLEDVDRAARELALYRALNQLPELSLGVPRPVETAAGELLHRTADAGWALTGTVAGREPQPQELELYPKLGAGLARLHGALSQLGPGQAVASTTLRDDLRSHQAAVAGLQTGMGTGGEAVVSEVGKRISVTGELLYELPAQLIHGDFCHPNLRVDEAGQLRGALDFEFCSHDPREFDVATLLLTLVTRSGASRVVEVAEQILTAYDSAAAAPIDREAVWVAAFARKLDSYFYHRNREESGRGRPGVAERQLTQMQQLLDVHSRGRGG